MAARRLPIDPQLRRQRSRQRHSGVPHERPAFAQARIDELMVERRNASARRWVRGARRCGTLGRSPALEPECWSRRAAARRTWSERIGEMKPDVPNRRLPVWRRPLARNIVTNADIGGRCSTAFGLPGGTGSHHPRRRDRSARSDTARARSPAAPSTRQARARAA